MGTLSIYLMASFFSGYAFLPNNKASLWKYAILIPLIVSLIYLAYSFTSNDFNSYKAGQTFAGCVIPAIISGVVIYFLLKKKLENGGVTKFPKILVAFIIITAGFGIFQTYMENSLKRDIKEIAPILENQNALNDIREAAKFIQSQLPIYISEDVLIYNVEFDENKNDYITYCRETEIDKNELTKEDIEFYENILRNNLLKVAKNNSKNKSFVKVGTTLTYNYEDKYGNQFLSITLHPDEYE